MQAMKNWYKSHPHLFVKSPRNHPGRDSYAHYLHHKYFEVNYADGGVPLDRWFGTFHDGTAAGEARMDARMAQKRARMTAARP